MPFLRQKGVRVQACACSQTLLLLGLQAASHQSTTVLSGWVVSLWVQFEGSRSAEEIRKFWQNFEHPSINKQEWSGQEVDQLKAIAAKHGHLQWQTIAKELGVRTGGGPRDQAGAGPRLGDWAGLGSPRAACHATALGAAKLHHRAAFEGVAYKEKSSLSSPLG